MIRFRAAAVHLHHAIVPAAEERRVAQSEPCYIEDRPVEASEHEQAEQQVEESLERQRSLPEKSMIVSQESIHFSFLDRETDQGARD